MKKLWAAIILSILLNVLTMFALVDFKMQVGGFAQKVVAILMEHDFKLSILETAHEAPADSK